MRVPTIYARVRRHWLSIRVLTNKGCIGEYEATASIAVRGAAEGEVIAAGEEAEAWDGTPDVLLHHAFDHPRVLIAGFDSALLVLRHFLRLACHGRLPLLGFTLVLHVQEELEGGLTDVESRALMELGLRAGARKVVICQEPQTLSDDEIMQIRPKQLTGTWGRNGFTF